MFVLDRDNVPRPVQKGTLRHQYVQGNLSDRLQISQDGDHFEPIETAAWFLDDSGDTPANAASIVRPSFDWNDRRPIHKQLTRLFCVGSVGPFGTVQLLLDNDPRTIPERRRGRAGGARGHEVEESATHPVA